MRKVLKEGSPACKSSLHGKRRALSPTPAFARLREVSPFRSTHREFRLMVFAQMELPPLFMPASWLQARWEPHARWGRCTKDGRRKAGEEG